MWYEVRIPVLYEYAHKIVHHTRGNGFYPRGIHEKPKAERGQYKKTVRGHLLIKYY